MTQTTPLPVRLELRQRIYMFSRAQRWGLWVLVLLMAGLLVAGLMFNLHRLTNGDWKGMALLEALLAKFDRDPVNTSLNALVFFMLTLQLAYVRLAQRRERLILTRTGIEYRSPLPYLLQALRPGWSLTWDQIRTATLQQVLRARDARSVVLELGNGQRKVKIFPFQWVDPASYQAPTVWTELNSLRKAKTETILTSVENSVVMRYMAGVAPRLAPKFGGPSSTGFALEKNPRALVVVVAFFVFLFYALGDTFFVGHEAYVGQPPYRSFFISGLLAAMAAVLWLRHAQVPMAESLGVALLFGAALGAAVYPGALRLNAFTDADGLRHYDYRLGVDLKLSPLVDGPPTLDFPRYADYWMHHKTDSVHTFELRQGGLGFYQLNMLPVEQRMREYYLEQNRAGDSSRR